MQTPAFYLRISIPRQCLELVRDGRVEHSYPVSTAKNGAGERRGSECTPRGWHQVRAKIGGGMPQGTVFVGRRPTGEVLDARLEAQNPQRDWILARILWLSGLEPGRNRYGEVDTAWRFIYIHGSPDHCVDGHPGSHGCIRMKSGDIVELYDRVPVGIRVLISEQP